MEAELTLTEALSEVNLIKKKIEAKKNTILPNLTRMAHVEDPFIKEGGTAAMLACEAQAIKDLNKRLEKIRAGISQANLSNQITICDETASIHDWLVWKRETASWMIDFIQTGILNVRKIQESAARQPQIFEDKDKVRHIVELKTNIDVGSWTRQYEKLVEMKERLDGQLSLKNATIKIKV